MYEFLPLFTKGNYLLRIWLDDFPLFISYFLFHIQIGVQNKQHGKTVAYRTRWAYRGSKNTSQYFYTCKVQEIPTVLHRLVVQRKKSTVKTKNCKTNDKY